jgi:hypothetical protein
MQEENNSNVSMNVTATVIRKDGTKIELGTISDSNWNWFNKIIQAQRIRRLLKNGKRSN